MSKKLWGGRFGKATDPLAEEFTRSIQYDYKLAEYDVIGSIAHVQILKNAGYLNGEEAARLEQGLRKICASVKAGTFKPDPGVEDIHTLIQNKLRKAAGASAAKLHTARSRNDQVVFAVKLYSRTALAGVQKEIAGLDNALKELAHKNEGLVIPGFTHLQHAQPVLLKDYLGAYSAMLKRDQRRIMQILNSLVLTLGAGACAGTPVEAKTYRVTVEYPATVLVRETENALDTVSDRDFVIEIISALAILATHLSRLSEDLIIWATKEFGFIGIDDAYCTGSSLMPQKKNPDVLELARGYAGRLYGNLVSVLTMMKGLPLAYNRDMQLDKEPLFNSFEIVSGELKVMAGLIRTLKFNKKNIEEHLKDESLYATDIVYYLVDKKIPFKEAHAIVGKLVRYSLDNGILIRDMPEDKLRQFSRVFVKNDVVGFFDPVVSVNLKKSIKRS